MTPKLAAIFVSNWNIYQRVITYNYMRHKEMAEQTRIAFSGLDAGRPLRVLDFGCGDSQNILPQLQLQPVATYTGYDLSGSALEFAKQNLAAVDCNVQLRNAPMQSFVELEKGGFDVIHSSYAIHHLQDDEKRSLLQQCYSTLRDKGVMIVVDIFCNQGQPRGEYIEEYISNIAATWEMITPVEQQYIFDHMRQYDFPVYAGDMAAWATEIGFAVKECRVDGLHTALVMEKN